jgi:hypothetical protein
VEITLRKKTANALCYPSAVPKKIGWLWYPYIPYGRITTLLTVLQQGLMPCADIYEYFREPGINERTVDTAKRMLKIKSIKNAAGRHWPL